MSCRDGDPQRLDPTRRLTPRRATLGPRDARAHQFRLHDGWLSAGRVPAVDVDVRQDAVEPPGIHQNGYRGPA